MQFTIPWDPMEQGKKKKKKKGGIAFEMTHCIQLLIASKILYIIF